ncbi:hypothetical protein C5B96_09970 [Subtercola sp. Z020]|nr:hypothetical protein C5B96_09970 [Subtercola sp. Z020]
MMEADDEAGGPMTDWWARFERDAAFRQATIDAYDGRHDVADAVWWVEHPESVAPSGAPAALAPLADLQRAAFARPNDADPGGTVSNLRELEAFRGMVEADRSETLAALEEAQAVLDARPAQRRRVGLLVGGLAAAVCVAGALAFGAVAVFAPGGSAGAFPLFGAGGASGSADGGGVDAAGSGADAGGSGAGSGGGSIGDGGSSYGATLGDPAASGTGTDGGVDGGGGAPEPALTAAPYPNFPPDTGAASYADIFAREQGAADRPPEPLPDGLVGETFRLLSGGQNTAGAVYVAVSTERMVCLVVYGSPLEYTYSCDTATGVGAHGLQSSISTRDRTDPATGALNPAIALSARWHPDGTFTLDRSTPYARG